MATDTEQITGQETPAEGAGQAGPPQASVAGEGAVAGGAKKRSPRSLAGIYVSTPQVLRDRLEAEAKEKNTSVAALVRDQLAGAYGITLPEVQPRTKYATPEEKVAARKAANKKRAELLKQLMAEHRAKQAELAKAAQAQAGASQGA